jgi:hypothetical protein
LWWASTTSWVNLHSIHILVCYVQMSGHCCPTNETLCLNVWKDSHDLDLVMRNRKGNAYGKLWSSLITSSSWGISIRQLQSITFGKVRLSSLFCFVLFCSYEMLQIVFLVSLESSWWGGMHGLWFHDIWTCGAKVFEYWIIFSLKIKLNQIVAENFGGSGMWLWCCWRDFDE